MGPTLSLDLRLCIKSLISSGVVGAMMKFESSVSSSGNLYKFSQQEGFSFEGLQVPIDVKKLQKFFANSIWSVIVLSSAIMAAICKMFGLHHFEALINDWSVGRHNFFHFFMFSIFVHQTQGKTKQKERSLAGDYHVMCFVIWHYEPHYKP